MRVALTRSTEDAAASAKRLSALGFTPVFAPVVTIRATGATPPDGAFDIVIATSAAALSAIAPEHYRRLAPLRLYVVGERTAEAAARVGLTRIRVVAPGGATLAATICDTLPQNSRALYLAGRDRLGGLEETLKAAGHRVVVCEIYEAQARLGWSDEEAQAFAGSDAVLHYSRRSGELAAALAEQASLSEKWRSILHLCISENAAEPLRSTHAKRIVIAAQASEAGLFDALKDCAKAG